MTRRPVKAHWRVKPDPMNTEPHQEMLPAFARDIRRYTQRQFEEWLAQEIDRELERDFRGQST